MISLTYSSEFTAAFELLLCRTIDRNCALTLRNAYAVGIFRVKYAYLKKGKIISYHLNPIFRLLF